MWNETPDGLKVVGDGAFCAGINRLVFHSATHQAWDERYRPGLSMGRWGTHFGRLQTWWQPGQAWIAYLGRCQAQLQWGQPAAGAFAVADGLAVRSIHRQGDNTDLFFVANPTRASGAARCVFHLAGRQPQLWDPVTGVTRYLPDFGIADGRTSLTLEFAPAQSFFIVFGKDVVAKAAEGLTNFPALKPQLELTGEWQVTFDPKWGGPAQPVRFENLTDWTRHAEPGIKYFSGTAVYRKVFDLADHSKIQDPQSGIYLDLGTVHHLARVGLNGKDLGVVWCAPWRVAVPAGVLKPAANQLEIAITNVWANRLIGDEQEPPDCEWRPGDMGGSYLKRFPDWFAKSPPRPSKGRYCFTAWNYFTKDSPLTPSGLLGPVQLQASAE